MGWSTFSSGHSEGRRFGGARKRLISTMRNFFYAFWVATVIKPWEVALKVVSCVLHLFQLAVADCPS